METQISLFDIVKATTCDSWGALKEKYRQAQEVFFIQESLRIVNKYPEDSKERAIRIDRVVLLTTQSYCDRFFARIGSKLHDFQRSSSASIGDSIGYPCPSPQG
jgi:hypothetical protein